MRLTRFTDYSLRALIYVGVRHPRLCSIKEVGERYGIAQGHLTKIVHELGRAGYLETVRGRGGGIRLGMDPSEINIGEVVRRTEPDFQIVECFGPETGVCCIEPVCALSPILEEAVAQFMSVLDRYTLEDLLASKKLLAQLFAIPADRP